MGVKTYQAYTVAEALSAAKRDLGADAVILETRTFQRGGVLGLGRRTIFELTATSTDRAELSGAGRGRRRRAAMEYGRASATAERRPQRVDAARTRRLAQALAEVQQRERGGEPATAVAAPPRSDDAPRRSERPPVTETPRAPEPAAPVPAPVPAGEAQPAAPRMPVPVARRFILQPAEATATRAAPELERGADTGPQRAAESAGAEMQEELSAIRTMVGQVLERQTRAGRRPPAVPEKLFGLYLELIGKDLSEELADRIVASVRGELDEALWQDQAAVREAVLRHLAELVPASSAAVPPPRAGDRPFTIALIGPTGVGKTTTLAKLAAVFKLRHGRKVGLVTCDTYRIAAVDQLRTYANIIGLPLEVALTPADVRGAVHALRDHDVILIDTAGRGQNDRRRLEELKSCLAAAEPHEVHLVLSSTAGEQALLREAEAFCGVGADRIVLTKLDEAVSFGVLINVMQAVGKQLSFITTGQDVPEHLEVGEPRRLAELVIGAASVS